MPIDAVEANPADDGIAVDDRRTESVVRGDLFARAPDEREPLLRTFRIGPVEPLREVGAFRGDDAVEFLRIPSDSSKSRR